MYYDSDIVIHSKVLNSYLPRRCAIIFDYELRIANDQVVLTVSFITRDCRCDSRNIEMVQLLLN